MKLEVNQLLLALPRSVKRLLAVTVDAALCVLSVWLAFGLRLDSWDMPQGQEWWATAVALALALPVFAWLGLYRAIFRYEGGTVLLRACALFGLAYATIFTAVGMPEFVPRTIGILVPVLVFLTVGGSRLLTRFWLGELSVRSRRGGAMPQVLVYGAGAAGRQIASALRNGPEMAVRAFVDDAPGLQGRTLNGLPILSPTGLDAAIRRYGITDVLLAMPSISRARRAEIVRTLHALQMPLQVRTLPGLADLAQGRVELDNLREIDVEDLLGREPVPPNEDLLHQKIRGKVVLVTGAGGSIGSELCRQIVKLGPVTLVLVDMSEYALYSIHQELEPLAAQAGVQLIPLMASVRDEAGMRGILATWCPQTIYHAAAYKHVPLVEHNAVEGIRNNTFGTQTMACLAIERGVSDFVLISTDKAVRPTNVMGASKRLAEMVLQALAQQGGTTRFSMVRFGNVLGSSGSVVPLFRKQIRDGGPITLTHADISRYFMTIPEAAQLVIQAGAMAKGGDVFVLDMGEPVRIIDLARHMVGLSGLTVRDETNPEGDIGLMITGLRPGEKLYEELLIGDNPEPTQHQLVMTAHEDFLPMTELTDQLRLLASALESGNIPAIKRLLKQVIPGYHPDGHD